VSFEQLLVHAYDIQRLATEKAAEAARGLSFENRGRVPAAPPGGGPPYLGPIQQEFADIPGLFGSFVDTPDPDWFDPAVRDFNEALRGLFLGHDTGQVTAAAKPEPGGPLTGTETYESNIALLKLSASESYIENWSGRAAWEFKRNFIHPFPAVVYNQFQIVAALRAALEAEREIWARVRRDIDGIAHDTLAALDQVNPIFPCDRNDWEMTFTVVGAVLTIPAAVATGGAAVALAVAAGGAAAAAAKAGQGDTPKTVRFHGETAEAVIAELRDGIAMLVGYAMEEEAKVAEGMTGLLQAVQGDESAYVSKKPELAGATKENVTGPLFMGFAS
jgi:hypothetical protein